MGGGLPERALERSARPRLPGPLVNIFVAVLLRILQIDTSKGNEPQQLSTDEIRTLVLESGQFMPKKHRSILVNLFDLGIVLSVAFFVLGIILFASGVAAFHAGTN